ncbi:MAG TPA: molybdopterin-dependent oxidoreductase, partial [Candidatus Dormibacteraeota bacterium]|nr:molybdopterin-dependent oxidoreductase [Candidatus Dormibacteraeota bacterium]
MAIESPRHAALRGFWWGALGGLALVALMYLANTFLGLRPLPQALSGPLLAIMPGFVFGFLIDTLQHAGKVVEELGLIVAMIAGLGVLGAGWAVTSRRWRFGQSALVFAFLGWLVVVMLLLPLSGAGFLGLNDGPTTPLVWAVLFAVYGMILQMGAGSGLPDAADPGRRRTIGAIPIAIGAISLGTLGLRLLPAWNQAIFNPPEAVLSGASPEITPVANFYVLSKNIGDPVVDGNTWSLTVGGVVDKHLKLSLADLRALPSTTEYVTMECVSNDVGGPLMSTGSFTGVSLRD